MNIWDYQLAVKNKIRWCDEHIELFRSCNAAIAKLSTYKRQCQIAYRRVDLLLNKYKKLEEIPEGKIKDIELYCFLLIYNKFESIEQYISSLKKI